MHRQKLHIIIFGEPKSAVPSSCIELRNTSWNSLELVAICLVEQGINQYMYV